MFCSRSHTAHRAQRGSGEEKGLRILLLTLSVATSIDALAVGLSFAFLTVNIALASSVIGVTAFIVTAIGFLAGLKVGKIVGKRAEVFGGIVLIAIGIRILISHLM